MDQSEAGPEVGTRKGVRVVDVNAMRCCPMPKQGYGLLRNTLIGQAMGVADFHCQEQVAWAIFVIGEIGGAVGLQVDAEMPGGIDGHMKGRVAGGGRQADGGGVQAAGSGHAFGKGATVDIAEADEDQPLRRSQIGLEKLIYATGQVFCFAEQHSDQPTVGAETPSDQGAQAPLRAGNVFLS